MHLKMLGIIFMVTFDVIYKKASTSDDEALKNIQTIMQQIFTTLDYNSLMLILF